MAQDPRKPRYAFGGFVLSPSRRVLLNGPRELPLIPRYFDLLVLLVEQRGEVVERRRIFDTVWSDVVVSDGALSQAVRTLRRALGDDPREPAFIRTVSRRGYRFVFADVVEHPDEAPLAEAGAALRMPGVTRAPAEADPWSALIARLLAAGPLDTEDRREAAEALHGLGTGEALVRLDRHPGHARARALLRDARWDVPGAHPVPLLGQPALLETAAALAWLRWRRTVRLAGGRIAGAIAGGASAGLLAGFLGGLALRYGPGSVAGSGVPFVLGLVGLTIGGLGAAGVGAGLAAAEVLARSFRGLALAALGALGGGAIGAAAHVVARFTIQGLFGRDLSPLAGGLEGLVLGAAVGLGYALATPRAGGGMAAPRGRARWRAVVLAGLATAAAAALLAAAGRYLGAMSLDFMAHAFPGSQVGLAPLARLLGEDEPGLATRLAISAWEGWMFGSGLVLGLTRRPGVSQREAQDGA